MKDLMNNAIALFFITMMCPILGIILLLQSKKIATQEKVVFSIMGTLTFIAVLVLLLK